VQYIENHILIGGKMMEDFKRSFRIIQSGVRLLRNVKDLDEQRKSAALREIWETAKYLEEKMEAYRVENEYLKLKVKMYEITEGFIRLDDAFEKSPFNKENYIRKAMYELMRRNYHYIEDFRGISIQDLVLNGGLGPESFCFLIILLEQYGIYVYMPELDTIDRTYRREAIKKIYERLPEFRKLWDSKMTSDV
jgi:hypothetical protein